VVAIVVFNLQRTANTMNATFHEAVKKRNKVITGKCLEHSQGNQTSLTMNL